MPSMSEARRMIAAAEGARANRRRFKRKLVELQQPRREEIILDVQRRDDIFAASVEHKAAVAQERALRDAEKAEAGYGRAYMEFWKTRALVIEGALTGKIADVFKADALRRMEQTRIDIREWDQGNLQEVHDHYLDLLSDGMLIGASPEDIVRGLPCFDAFGKIKSSVSEVASSGGGVVVRNDDGDMLQIDGHRLRICRLRQIEGSATDIGTLNAYVVKEQRRVLDEVLQEIELLVEQNGGARIWYRSEVEALEAFRPDWYLRRTAFATRIANELHLRLGRSAGELAPDFRFKPGEEPYKDPDVTISE